MSYLCGSAAGPVRRPNGDVDAGRRLRVGGVATFGSWQPRDDQAAGEAAFPKQKAECGRRWGDLGERHEYGATGKVVVSYVESACMRGKWRHHLTGALLMLCSLKLRADPACSWQTRDLKKHKISLYSFQRRRAKAFAAGTLQRKMFIPVRIWRLSKC